jgi:IS30 family transposase
MAKKNNKVCGASPLSLKERGIIEARWCRDFRTITDIAAELGRNKSSISREISGKPRKGRGKYNADIAHKSALGRIGRRGNMSKSHKIPKLKAYIEEKLKRGWSPEQIHIRMPHDFPDDKVMRVATETVYQEIYRRVHREGNGTVKRGEEDLRPYLARRHKRRARKGFRKARKAERDAILPSIEKRPQTVERRSRIGDWEDDTLVSRQSLTRVKSVNERRSGVVFFGKTKDGTAERCDEVLVRKLQRIPHIYRRTLTRDRGSENMRYGEISVTLGVDVYFAHPYSSYERGSNENANGLLRRYFPKKTDWSKVSDEEIDRAEYLINTRPRKRHGGLTPIEVFYMETGVAIYP